MKTPTTEQKLIELGAKIWEKESIKRIYVKSALIKKLINFAEECKKDAYLEKNTKAIFARIDKEGAWFNCDSQKFESKKASVQDWFDTSEFNLNN